MPVSQQGGRIGSESGGAVSLSTTALLLRSMEAAMGIVPLDAARPAPASPRRIRSAIHHRTRGQAPSPLPSPQLQWYHRDTRLNPSVFHREPRAVTVRRQLGAVTEGEDDSETDSDTDGSDDDGAESGYGASDMPSRSGSSVASGAKHSSLGFKTSSENAYFETLVRLNYVLHPERVADLVELVDHLCPPSYKAGQKTRRGAGSAGPDPVPYRSHFVRALLALPVGALTEVAEAHPLPPPGCDATEDHQSPWLWAHVALLRKAGRGVDAIRLLLRTGRWLAALDMLTEAEVRQTHAQAVHASCVPSSLTSVCVCVCVGCVTCISARTARHRQVASQYRPMRPCLLPSARSATGGRCPRRTAWRSSMSCCAMPSSTG